MRRAAVQPPGESRVELRHEGEREWRCRHALVAAGERVVPEALQGAEIVAVGGPLELGPMFASHQVVPFPRTRSRLVVY
jgi:hypothetical protein